MKDQILELKKQGRREKFKAGLNILLNKRQNSNLSDEDEAIDDLLSVVNVENVENVQVEQVEQSTAMDQILDFPMGIYGNLDSSYNVDMDSGISNCYNEGYESSQYQFDYSPQTSPVSDAFDDVPIFDQATLILICQKIKAIEGHLECFKTVNSVILKRALESEENETLLDKDNYLYLRAVRGILLHKMFGELMDYQVRESLMSIAHNIDLLLHPELEVSFDTNEPFCFEKWSDKFIKNHSD